MMMAPPKGMVKKRKQKRDYNDATQNHSHSMPSTPNLESRNSYRSSEVDGSDSDTAYGFTNNWGN